VERKDTRPLAYIAQKDCTRHENAL
jgi:hypothetical protein